MNNLLSPSSTSRSIDYHSLQPGKFSIRVSFPHRQCFYPASFHTGKVSLRQGLYSGQGSSLTRFPPRQEFSFPLRAGPQSVASNFCIRTRILNHAKIWRQHMPPYFLAKLVCRKITCTVFVLRTMSTPHRPFIFLRAIIMYRPCLVWTLRCKLGWNLLSFINNPMIKFHGYVFQGHPPNHIVLPFARILQIIKNELPPILTYPT